MDARLERNNQTVTAFDNLMFNQRRPREAIERVFAEGDHVVLHCPQEWPTDTDRDWAAI